MPVRHGIDVSVMTPDGKVLTEYATQNLSRVARKSKFVSTRIQAIEGQSFYIRVKPITPFPYDDDNDRKKLSTATFARVGSDPFITDRYNLRPRPAPDFDEKQPIEEPTAATSAAPLDQQKSDAGALCRKPPFDLSVFVYIDGHKKPECRQIVWLDPQDSRYHRDGIVLKGRWVQGDGNTSSVGVHNWVFTSVGIDVLMGRMNMRNDDSGRQTTDDARDFEELADAMAQNRMDSEVRPKPGQIEVRVTRIQTRGVPKSQGFRAYHYAGTNDVADAARIGADVTHTMTLRESQERNMRLNTVAWRPFKMNEEVYATFVFNYVGRERLVKMGLCHEDGTPALEGRIHAPEPITPAKIRKRDQGDDSDEGTSSLTKFPRAPVDGDLEEATGTGTGQRRAQEQANNKLQSLFVMEKKSIEVKSEAESDIPDGEL